MSEWREYPIAVAGVGVKRWRRTKRDADQAGGKIEENWDRSGVVLMVDRGAEKWGPTHLQYDSRAGFLLQWFGTKWWRIWHACFTVWIQFKKQGTRPNPNAANDPSIPTLRVPGSEVAWMFRIGWGRWQDDTGEIVGGKTFKVLGREITIPFGTIYGPFNLHLD